VIVLRENKILIVDDKVSILTMLKEFFYYEGFTVRTAGSAEEALKIVPH
jgi:DNA-binding response OmpR family regulator